MDHPPSQASNRLPSLSLKQTFLLGNRAAGVLRHEQRVIGLSCGTGLAPGGPLRAGLPMARAASFDADAVTPGIEKVAQQRLRFVSVLRTNQIAEPQPAPRGHAAVQGPLEGWVHLDNQPLRVAEGYGDRSVFEGGTESCAWVLSRWGI